MGKKNIVFMLATACAIMALGATPGELAEAKEVNVRQGVGNFIAKLKAGKPVTVAYLGGSITEMSGWRNMTTDWLRKTYPAAEVEEVHAAIGGTGSGLGVFRLGH
ncbi:MAG: SGNH/GDSL hydrolase family protein, partial [Kiritimatiellae bacterium]|nr:SGNH/GDSL hydrolase family protein [Kiritimatiellia bacterium]